MSAISHSPLIFTDCSGERRQILPMDIFYIEADNIYCRILCKDQIIHIPYPISLMEELLPEYFLRIHRSFLINRHCITALYRRTVVMANGCRLPVPDRNYQWLKHCLEKAAD